MNGTKDLGSASARAVAAAAWLGKLGSRGTHGSRVPEEPSEVPTVTPSPAQCHGQDQINAGA